jgi:very-short-patch-repair endonuclease
LAYPLFRSPGEGEGEGPLNSKFVDLSLQRDRARRLQNHQTDAERKLWQYLRARQLRSAKFRRQIPIGPIIADFCCVERRLIIELDGGQHAARAQAGRARTDCFAERGYRTLRFWNDEVLKNPEAVLERIRELL